MPITLITGLPGHGKTIEAIRMMRDDYSDRKIYAANFPGLAYDFLNVEEFDPMRWTKCEAGAILFIDEAWEFFEARGPHKMPPDVIKELARHRHYGLDFVLITQGPFQLDSHVRTLVETHLHVIRPFGMKYYIVRKFRGTQPRPDDNFARKNAADTSTRRKFDKRLFDYYKSAEVHTIKRKVPFKLVGSVVILLGLVVAVWNMLAWGSNFLGKDDQLVDQGGDLPVVDQVHDPFSLPRRSAGEKYIDIGSDQFDDLYDDQVARYYLKEKDLVNGAPWTAAKWTEIMEPVTFPKPICMYSQDQDECICHSQQATIMQVDHDICVHIAINGWFDPTLDDLEIQEHREFSAIRYRDSKVLAESKKERIPITIIKSTDGTTLPYILERIQKDKKTFR